INKIIYHTIVTSLSLLLIVGCSASDDTNVDAENNNEQNDQSDTSNVDENINETGLPIVKEPIELDFFVALNPGVPGNLNEITSMKEYTELSNITINWDEAANESMEEKRNLALGSDQLPDAFFGSDLPTSDIFKYAKQGTFIALDDLIDEHAPNLKSILDAYPDIRSAITYPDEHIYSLPYIRDPEFISPQAFPLMYYHTDILDAVGMEAPETTEEFHEFLKAAKDENPDIIPFA